jgi:hypothetical protein
MTGAFEIYADHAFARTICEDRHILRSANEDEGRRPDLTFLNAPHQNGRPSSLTFPSSKPFKDLVTLLYPLPVVLLTIIPHFPKTRKSAVAYTSKINKYQDVCTANGVSFLPIIIESNGYIHPQARQFLQDLAKQAAFYRPIPWHNLFYLSHLLINVVFVVCRIKSDILYTMMKMKMMNGYRKVLSVR